MYFAGSFKEFIRYVDIGPLMLAEVSLGLWQGSAVRFLALRKQRASALQTHVTPCQWDGVLSLSTSYPRWPSTGVHHQSP